MGNSNNHLSDNARHRADSHRSKWHSLDDMKWTYGREKGPENWWVYFPQANGHHQSPIDINPEVTEFDTDLKTYPLSINYFEEENRILSNTGHGWRVQMKRSKSFVTGGPAQAEKFYLHEFHMHWGDMDDCGSEHIVHGRAFSGEIHFVHYNAKYGDYKSAMDQPDGLLVLAVFVKASGGLCSSGLDLIYSHINNIKYKGEAITLTGLSVGSLFPGDLSKYWVYRGSLTTPPCHEAVRWVIFYEPIHITSYQLSMFRCLYNHHITDIDHLAMDEGDRKIVKNYRPVQLLSGRTIYTTEHVFMGYPEFNEQFHEQNLFTTYSDISCQYHRQGLL